MSIMKRILISLCALCLCGTTMAEVVASPAGTVKVTVDVNAQGTPYYSVNYKDRPAVAKSTLRLELLYNGSRATSILCANRRRKLTFPAEGGDLLFELFAIANTRLES